MPSVQVVNHCWMDMAAATGTSCRVCAWRSSISPSVIDDAVEVRLRAAGGGLRLRPFGIALVRGCSGFACQLVEVLGKVLDELGLRHEVG